MPARFFGFSRTFETLPLWDPGIDKSRLVAGQFASADARYEVVSRFFMQRIALRYATTRYDADKWQAVLEGNNESVRAVDRIVVSEREGGCRLRWQADFELKGPRRLFEGLSRPLFVRLGKQAMSGLERYAQKNPRFSPPYA